jgi:hypothetical protein
VTKPADTSPLLVAGIYETLKEVERLLLAEHAVSRAEGVFRVISKVRKKIRKLEADYPALKTQP